jgi:hypothetical protein
LRTAINNYLGHSLRLGVLVLNLACISIANADSEIAETPDLNTVPVQLIPDLRDEEMKLKVQRGDIVAVPTPIPSPTFGSGLVLGSACFYAQTEEQMLS